MLAVREWFIAMRPCATTRDARERSQAAKPALDILKLLLKLRGLSGNELRSWAGCVDVFIEDVCLRGRRGDRDDLAVLNSFLLGPRHRRW